MKGSFWLAPSGSSAPVRSLLVPREDGHTTCSIYGLTGFFLRNGWMTIVSPSVPTKTNPVNLQIPIASSQRSTRISAHCSNGGAFLPFWVRRDC